MYQLVRCFHLVDYWMWAISKQCVLLTKFVQVFDVWHAKTCTKIKCTCSVTCDENNHTSVDILKLTWHVLLGMWHWGDILDVNVDVNWHSFSFSKTSRDTLDLKLNVKRNLSNIHNVSKAHDPGFENLIKKFACHGMASSTHWHILQRALYFDKNNHFPSIFVTCHVHSCQDPLV